MPPPTKPAAKGRARPGRFQIVLSGKWQNYNKEEDQVLKQAYLVGQSNAKYALRGHSYEYNFTKMVQVNTSTGKERQIRQPKGMTAPKSPLLPAGPVIVITVPKGAAGQTIEVDDPNNKGKKIKVNVPPGAKAGQKMAVPVPQKGETVEAVQAKQKSHSAGAKLAMGVAGLGALTGAAVGGVILGDHLAGGDLATDIGEHATTAAEAAADWTADAAEDAAEWTAGAAEDAGEWIEGAAGDTGEWVEGAAEDTVEWLEDAGEDIADFVMNLF